MREPWRERLAMWICKRFGHRPFGDPTPLGGERFCRRCGRLANEEEPDTADLWAHAWTHTSKEADQ